MNRSRMLKNAVVFFLFFGLLSAIHWVNEKRKKEILAEIWINPKQENVRGTLMDARKQFIEDDFFESLMNRIVQHHDTVFTLYLTSNDSALVAGKLIQNPRFIVH
jgi:hypothetical protein